MNLRTMSREITFRGNGINERDIRARSYKGRVCVWFGGNSYLSKTYYGEYSPVDSNNEIVSIANRINKAFLKYKTETVNDPRVINEIEIIVDKYRYKKYEGIQSPEMMLAYFN